MAITDRSPLESPVVCRVLGAGPGGAVMQAADFGRRPKASKGDNRGPERAIEPGGRLSWSPNQRDARRPNGNTVV